MTVHRSFIHNSKNLERTSYPQVELVDKSWYIRISDYYTAMKNKPLHAAVWEKATASVLSDTLHASGHLRFRRRQKDLSDGIGNNGYLCWGY